MLHEDTFKPVLIFHVICEIDLAKWLTLYAKRLQDIRRLLWKKEIQLWTQIQCTDHIGELENISTSD